MENHAERLNAPERSRRWWAAVLVLALLVAALVWHFRGSGAESASAGAEQSLTVARRPFSTTITLAGTIQPGDGAVIFAPFDGTVRSVDFAYGDRATTGQILATLDTSEIEDRRNAAEADFLKSQQAMADLANWASSPDVARARRARTAASMDMGNIDRRIVETRALLDKGLVPRAEYDGLMEQRRSQALQLAAADEDYATTMRRGQGSNARVAALELMRTRNVLADLNGQLRAATIHAPADGILVRPPRGAAETSDDIHVGSHVARGQLIGSIARAGALSAEFKLDEIDVNKIKVGQRVSVTGPGFGGAVLPGSITNVGGEAIKGTGPSATKASFAAIARLDPVPPAIAAVIRLGMTATIAVETYAAPAAIVVPPAAVSGAAPSATVTVQRGGTRTPRIVKIGQVSPEGVEILAGLKPGEVIVWSEAPQPPAPAS